MWHFHSTSTFITEEQAARRLACKAYQGARQDRPGAAHQRPACPALIAASSSAAMPSSASLADRLARALFPCPRLPGYACCAALLPLSLLPVPGLAWPPHSSLLLWQLTPK